jgi:hypothetical protein
MIYYKVAFETNYLQIIYVHALNAYLHRIPLHGMTDKNLERLL